MRPHPFRRRALQAALPQHLPVLVAGSTLAGEDDLILDAWQHLRRTGVACALVLAPRHVERWPAVAELLRTRAIPFVRASGWSISPSHMSQSASPVPVAQSGAARQTLQPGTVFLLDTIGDLASVYSLATIAFIGGSLVTGGGHNPLEPARFGVPVVQGPSFHNFREVVQAMQSRDAIRVVDSEHLAGTLRDLLCNAGVAHALGQRGQQVFLAQSGARDRSVAALLQLLGSAHAAPQATESLLQTELQ
jgi:3-deoxy-D-manno-octulosonic-acid transferase